MFGAKHDQYAFGISLLPIARLGLFPDALSMAPVVKSHQALDGLKSVVYSITVCSQQPHKAPARSVYINPETLYLL